LTFVGDKVIQNILNKQEKIEIISEISARLQELIDNLNFNANSFAKALSYERSQAIYDLLNGKAMPSSDFFLRLKKSEYSDISIDWILTGEGEMLRSKKEVVEPGQAPECSTCRYKKDVERYEKDIDRYLAEIDRLHRQLAAKENEELPSKRRTA
jgi:Na+/phosphate symporter